MKVETMSQEIMSLNWNIKDATEALTCAVSLQDWNGCIKYANQLKVLEEKLFLATAPRTFPSTVK
jgi:hypothetical protein